MEKNCLRTLTLSIIRWHAIFATPTRINMVEYIDGFVLPVRTDPMEDYERISRLCSEVYLKHGATEYRECRGAI